MIFGIDNKACVHVSHSKIKLRRNFRNYKISGYITNFTRFRKTNTVLKTTDSDL